MRPVNDHNSTMKAPLNEILGYQANIRLLRSLIETGNVMSHSELAKRTGLSLPGIHKVVPRMIKTGIIKYSGSGKQQQVELRKDHPLSQIIKDLFEAEREYYDSLIKNIKKEIEALELKPKSAWIFGKLAQGTDEYGDPLRIALLGDVKTMDEITDEFRDRIYHADIEKKYDVTVDITGLTLADLGSRPANYIDQILLIWGYDPHHYMESPKGKGGKKRTHRDLVRQSLIDSRAWSELLKTHPEIIRRTIKYLEERIQQTGSGEKKELQEWKRILESMSHQRLKKFLESDSERSTRLHQSLPFWPVLKDSEREKLKEIKSEQTQNHG